VKAVKVVVVPVVVIVMITVARKLLPVTSSLNSVVDSVVVVANKCASLSITFDHQKIK
jgi:hypothetical protein